ncbi:hypothetical protein RCC89_02310 [Cytophagaceae bacterium ABcell3]|nr:hypothetical protein RCC89_02310 [Cytophagaceae bacterium ABcell3]
MGKPYIFLFLLFLFLRPVSAQNFLELGYAHSFGLSDMANGITGSHGFSGGYYTYINKDAYNHVFFIGGIASFNRYGRTKRSMVPYVRDNYVHDLANIENMHNYFFVGPVIRYQADRLCAIVKPFLEAGAGLGIHYSLWRARDPYRGFSDDCEGYSHQESINTSATLYAMAGIGVAFKVKRGVLLSLSTNVQRGGNISYRNSQIEPDQFSYSSGVYIDKDNGRGHEQVGESHAPDFRARHFLMTFNLRVQVNFNNISVAKDDEDN